MITENINLLEEQFIKVCDDFILHHPINLRYFMVLKQTFVHKPLNYNDCNISYVQQHNILMKELPREGGTIVGSPGDVECIYFMEHEKYNGMPEEIQNLISLITSKGYTPQIDNNDVLINNYKVASWSSKLFGNITFIAVVVSVNLDMEKINNICLKVMGKTPKALSDFGITSEEVQRAFGLIA